MRAAHRVAVAAGASERAGAGGDGGAGAARTARIRASARAGARLDRFWRRGSGRYERQRRRCGVWSGRVAACRARRQSRSALERRRVACLRRRAGTSPWHWRRRCYDHFDHSKHQHQHRQRKESWEESLRGGAEGCGAGDRDEGQVVVKGWREEEWKGTWGCVARPLGHREVSYVGVSAATGRKVVR